MGFDRDRVGQSPSASRPSLAPRGCGAQDRRAVALFGRVLLRYGPDPASATTARATTAMIAISARHRCFQHLLSFAYLHSKRDSRLRIRACELLRTALLEWLLSTTLAPEIVPVNASRTVSPAFDPTLPAASSAPVPAADVPPPRSSRPSLRSEGHPHPPYRCP